MNKLKELRKKYNITSYEMADLLNVSIRTYYNIENDKSPMSSMMIKVVSQKFNVTSDYLLGISNFNQLNTKEEKDRESLISCLNFIFKE